MHKYRHAARVNAWYDQPDDENNLNFPIKNPFAKRRPTQAQSNFLSDQEEGHSTGVRRQQTDDPHDYESHSNARRDFAGELRGRGASTAPDAKSNPARNQKDDGEIPRADSPSNLDAEEPAKQSTQEIGRNEDSSETFTEDKPSRVNTNPEVRNRKASGIKGFFKHEKQDDNDNDNGKQKPNFTFMSQIRATILNSWINILLIASPVGFAVHFANVNPVAVFVVNFIAIIPLAAMLSYATEEIALHTGEVFGGLLNASFGNAVELIVSIIALAKNQVLIVQTSLIGSMLSNLLLVMGMSFFFGGVNRYKQEFNQTVAQTASSLLFLAVGSLIIPTAFDEFARTGDTSSTSADDLDVSNLKPGVRELSRGTAILLLIVYGCYLFFQLKSHTAVYSSSGNKNATRDVSGKMKNMLPEKMRRRSLEDQRSDEQRQADKENEGEQQEEAQLYIWVAVLTLGISTVLVAFNAEFLVDSINAITCGGGISKNFVGLILLPIVGNAAEHATAVTVACKDKMDLAIGVAIGSSLQIALLVLPFVVVLGWIMGKSDMTLFFDGFQITVLFVAVILVNYLIQDGESHWLEGILLMILYIIIAVAAWFYPTAPGLSDCPADS